MRGRWSRQVCQTYKYLSALMIQRIKQVCQIKSCAPWLPEVELPAKTEAVSCLVTSRLLAAAESGSAPAGGPRNSKLCWSLLRLQDFTSQLKGLEGSSFGCFGFWLLHPFSYSAISVDFLFDASIKTHHWYSKTPNACQLLGRNETSSSFRQNLRSFHHECVLEFQLGGRQNSSSGSTPFQPIDSSLIDSPHTIRSKDLSKILVASLQAARLRWGMHSALLVKRAWRIWQFTRRRADLLCLLFSRSANQIAVWTTRVARLAEPVFSFFGCTSFWNTSR